MKITAHTLVKNEEKYLWYAVKSVIDHVDKMLLWDSGSTDNTIQIIKLLKKEYPEKISTNFVKQIDIYHFTKLRQEMLEQTKTDWFMIADGDEIWWKDSIRNIISSIRNSPNLDYVISSYYSPVGDIYHYQPENQAKYKIKNYTGHINIRATKTNIKGLHFDKPHGQQGLFDHENQLIQDQDYKYLYIKEPAYLHMTNLVRSTKTGDENVAKRKNKFKISKGISFPLDFFYPEALFLSRPDFVPNIWVKRNHDYEKKAYLLDFARVIKAKLPIAERSGY